MSLSVNLFASFTTSIDALAASRSSTFPSLTSLRVSDNPLFQTCATSATAPGLPTITRSDDRQALHSRLRVIARLPFLTELEGTAVSQAERDDAERFWLEQVGRDEEEEEAKLSEWARGRLAELKESELTISHPGLDLALSSARITRVVGQRGVEWCERSCDCRQVDTEKPPHTCVLLFPADLHRAPNAH
jgi:hypothetical protein